MNASGVKLQIGRLDRNYTLYIFSNPNHTATTQMGLVGDADQRQGTPTEWMARIRYSYRLFRR